MPKKEIFELERQLHEQYAINNNSNLSSIIALMTTLLAVFGVYGYVFIHTNIEFANNWGNLIAETNCDKAVYHLDVLILATLSAYFVLIVLYYLANYIGVNQRKEQFITYAIRQNYYHRNNTEYDKVYPKGYTPFNKSITDFVQGLYGEISCILKITFYLITFLTSIKILFNIKSYVFMSGICNASLCDLNWFNSIVFVLSVILTIWVLCCVRRNFYYSYLKREKEYIQKKWLIKKDKINKLQREKSVTCFKKLCCKIKYKNL